MDAGVLNPAFPECLELQAALNVAAGGGKAGKKGLTTPLVYS